MVEELHRDCETLRLRSLSALVGLPNGTRGIFASAMFWPEMLHRS